MNLKKLIAMSRKYGADSDYVLAGGGNTSYKEDDRMAVKASGAKLADIDEAGFVEMNAAALRAMVNKQYPAEDQAREAAALEDMGKAKLPGQEAKRPSVECILHALFPFPYVLHVHPALINGVTCGRAGEAFFSSHLAADDDLSAIWIPLTKPGFVLSKVCHEAFQAYDQAHGKPPQTMFLQNHGIFIAGGDPADIDRIMQRVLKTISAQIKEEPDLTPEAEPEESRAFGEALCRLYADKEGSAAALFFSNKQLSSFSEDSDSMRPLLQPFTPDHIVYCKAAPLYLPSGADIQTAFSEYTRINGYAPKIAVLQNAGAFALGKSKQEAEVAAAVFVDGIKIAVYARSFGGDLPLEKSFTDFILNWEAESYRQKASFQKA
ncbi:MAG: class II aldolase/adducin family protein [Clostridiales Family XIII bacterium]|jgi:rhamnose utilization protein RhaD (predicted bifunctional aldolase and dehydrogenase)|nr:class II aldolase/adducin family protein [Clostridiales Family XIII bacterium]